MPTEQKMLYCNNCKATTLHIQKVPNHILHLILAIITAGLWIIIWIFQSKGTPQCTQCGKSNNASQSTSLLSWIIIIIFAILFAIFINKPATKTETTQPEKILPKAKITTTKPKLRSGKFPKDVSTYCTLLKPIGLNTKPIEKLKGDGYGCLPIKKVIGKTRNDQTNDLSYYVYSKQENSVNQLNFILNIGDTKRRDEAKNELVIAVNTALGKLGVMSSSKISDLIISESNISTANGPYNITIEKKIWDNKKGDSFYISIQ